MWQAAKNQRHVLSEETGPIIKNWGGKTSVALVYPNTYYVGMSNLAVHTIYKLFNDNPQIVCERAFLPDPKTLEEHKRTKTPILSLETQRPLSEFDAIAFSISFQNDFLNILPILELCSIPHLKSERKKDHPLLIAGGAAVTINHRPLAKIFDAFVIGEGEEAVGEIAQLLTKGERLEGVLGTRRVVRDLNRWQTQTVIYTKQSEFSDMHLIETGRGCPRKCKFCVTPRLYEPLRMRSFDALIEMVRCGLPYRNRFGLIGSDLLSHKAFVDVANAIHECGATFSPSSLCVDEIDDNVAALLARSGHKSISLGVEAATDVLRSSIGKKFPGERILCAAESLARHGITSLRLYFMIGLPGETQEDIMAIADLSKRVQAAIHKSAPKSSRATNVTLTITPFVPKPMTPFENEPFAGEKYLKNAVGTLKKILGKTKGIGVHSDPVIFSVCDALLSKGGEELITFLEESHQSGLRKALS